MKMALNRLASLFHIYIIIISYRFLILRIFISIIVVICVSIIQDQIRIGTNSFKNITVMPVLIILLILCIDHFMMIILNPILNKSIKRV